MEPQLKIPVFTVEEVANLAVAAAASEQALHLCRVVG